MDEVIKIKCPFCGAVLSVKKMPDIESKNVTCPICKHKYRFTEYKQLNLPGSNNGRATEYPHSQSAYEDHTTYPEQNQSDKTEIIDQANFTLGKLKIAGTTVSYQLKPGRNVIGRKAQKSVADFQIETGEKRAMSREHIVIDVKKVTGKGFVHCLSLYKEKVNDTYIGNDLLVFGDCIVLAHGALIRLPDASLRFEIPDDDTTDI